MSLEKLLMKRKKSFSSMKPFQQALLLLHRHRGTRPLRLHHHHRETLINKLQLNEEE
jgi:hypothetical protein